MNFLSDFVAGDASRICSLVHRTYVPWMNPMRCALCDKWRIVGTDWSFPVWNDSKWLTDLRHFLNRYNPPPISSFLKLACHGLQSVVC
ncbi:MAG: hypothetical protein SGI77_25300 [Pirellulaceae bacterium]|nr:hypothetical protein [Pirellulaceae bacterium]